MIPRPGIQKLLDASPDIRPLVGRLILHPGDKQGEVYATLHGSLMGYWTL